MTEHNKCYRETIEYLESQLKHRTEDLTTLAQSFNKSKGLQLSSMLRKDEQKPTDLLESREDTFERDETGLA